MTPSIQYIKDAVAEKSPHFFSRDTLRFFGQTLSDFKVWKGPSGDYYIAAPSYWYDNGKSKFMGVSFRKFTGDNLKQVEHPEFKSMEDAKEWVKTKG